MLDTILALAHASVLGLPAPLPSSRRLQDPLQPTTYRSPSGDFALHVDPSDRYGAGPGRYTMTQGTSVVWEKELPVTAWRAGVTDSGHVAGYAYSAGYLDGNAKGSFHLLILDAEGRVLLDDVTKREPGRGFHSTPDPTAGALVVHDELDRVLVEILLPTSSGNSWRAYSLSSARRIDDWSPSLPFEPRGRERLFHLAARALPGTNLVLMNWKFVDFATDLRGGVFSLLDAEGRTHWTLERRHDYLVPDDKGAERKLDTELRRTGAIMDTDERTFSLWFPSERSRARFCVTRSDEEWVVTQDSTEPFDLPSADPVGASPLELELVSTSVLGSGPNEGVAARIRGFGFTDSGQHEVIRGDSDDALRYQKMDHVGTIEIDVAVEDLPSADEGLRWFDGNGDTWYAVANHWRNEGGSVLKGSTSDVYRLNVLTNAWLAFEGKEIPVVKRLVPTADGGFLVLGTIHGGSQMSEALLAFNRSGEVVWRVDEDYDAEGGLFSPADVAVTADGVVVVLDVIRKRLQLFSSTGTYLRYVDLAAAWGEDPRYPSRLAADGEGGVWITDYPSVWHVSLDGRVIETLEPKSSNGSAPRLHWFAISNEGVLWYSDGNTLASFGPDGLVDETIGEPPSADQLQLASMAWIEPGGRIIVEDERSGVWHVFTDAGERLFTCPPPVPFRPSTFGNVPSRLSPAGEQVGPGAMRPGVSWHGDHGGLNRIDDAGAVVTRLARDPENRWWWPRISAFSLSPDASTLAVLGGPGRLSVFDGDGTNGRIFDVTGVAVVQVAASNDWVALAGFRTDVHLFDLTSETLHRVEISESDSTWRWGFSPSGRELWGVDFGALALHRFALPAR